MFINSLYDSQQLLFHILWSRFISLLVTLAVGPFTQLQGQAEVLPSHFSGVCFHAVPAGQ